MRGKTGHWGTPFTRQNANLMRLRGLATRRENAARRLLKDAREAEPVKWELQEVQPGVWEQMVTDSPFLRAERAKQAQTLENHGSVPVTLSTEAKPPIAPKPDQIPISASPQPARHDGLVPSAVLAQVRNLEASSQRRLQTAQQHHPRASNPHLLLP